MAPIEELALLDLDRSNKGASKQRRDQINAEIARMRDLLPLPESSRQRLSQLQIMSLTCVFIRKCNTLHKLFRNKSQEQLPDSLDFFQALTGFLLVTTKEGKLLYISENVTDYLGHSMVDMKTQGDSLYDIVDKRDHATVKGQLLQAGASTAGAAVSGSTVQNKDGEGDVSFFCRMNMSRTLKRQSGFGDVKVMHIRGHFLTVTNAQDKTGCLADTHSIFMATCTPLITPDIKENLIQSNTLVFKTAHKLDMTFVEATKTAEYHLGYTTEELSTKSWYSLLHPEDIHEAKDKHVQLIRSNHEIGCMLTVRMLRQDGTAFWVNTVMHVRQSSFGDNDDAYIVCINQVINAKEAYQIKMQGHLFTMYPSRAHEIWGNHLTAVAATPEQQGAHAWIQQDGSNAVPVPGYQSNLPSFISQMGRPPLYNHSVGGVMISPNRMARHPTEMTAHYTTASLVQSDKLKAMLKRKIQGPPQGTTCKPSKMAKYSVDMNGSNGGCGYSPSGDHRTPYSDHFGFGSQFASGEVDCGGQALQLLRPVVYGLGKHSSVVCNGLLHKGSSAMHSEQVVPNVSVPDSYLTPDPSPANSPQPNKVSSGQHGFATIKAEVIDPEENASVQKSAVNIIQALENLVARPQKPAASRSSIGPEAHSFVAKQQKAHHQPMQKRRELPIFDAFDIDNFFDTLDPLDDEAKASVKVESSPLKHEIKVEVKEEPQVPTVSIPDFAALCEKEARQQASPGGFSQQMSPESIISDVAADTPHFLSVREAPSFSFDSCNGKATACSPPHTGLPTSNKVEQIASSNPASSPASSVTTQGSIDEILSFFSEDGVVSPLQMDPDKCSSIFDASSPKESVPDHLDSSFEQSYFTNTHCSIPFKMESQRQPEELSPGSSIGSLNAEDDWMDNDDSATLALDIAMDVVTNQRSGRQTSSPFSAKDKEVLGMPQDLKLDFILDSLLPSQGSLKMIKHGQ